MVEPDDAVLEVEDEDFLSAVAAAEANALSNKRRRTYTSNAAEEGVYTAALRGSNSLAWKQSATTAFGAPSSRGLSSVSSSGKSDGGGSPPPEKPCPCGLGACLILTSNTQKNPGRKFYKCPVREENGGCGFFQWCDNSSGISDNAFGTINYGLNSSFPDLKCPCGAGSCLILTAKTGNNAGQQFYRCPANQNQITILGLWIALWFRELLVGFSNGAMIKLYQLVFRSVLQGVITLPPMQASKAMGHKVVLPVSNVARKGTGQKIARCLHLITLLIQEEGLLHQVPVINVVCLVTGQETALLVKIQKYGRDGKSVTSGSL